jgi:hypothetical protein
MSFLDSTPYWRLRMKAGLIGSLAAAAFLAGASGSARAAEIQRFSFIGDQTSVGFYGTAAITCSDGSTGVVGAFGSLQASNQIIASTGFDFQSNGIFIEVDSYFNSCTGVGFGFSEAGVSGGFTPPDKHLTSAALVGSGLLQDFGSGMQVPISVNVQVTGTGNTSTSKGNSKSTLKGSKSGPISITTSHSFNTNRSGDASGTISIDGVNINAQFYFAFMNLNDNSQMSVNK